MEDDTRLAEAFEARAERRSERRDFFKAVGAAGAGAMALGLGAGRAAAQTAPTDADVLNFALNLEYLEAQFYYYAAFGEGLPANLLTGTGTQGAVIPGRQVPFAEERVRNYAREIAQDERAHVEFLRRNLAGATVAQPAIDIGVGPNNAFSNAARAAGLIGAGATFNPYENDNNFLLGAFIFEDVGVTAYKGASVLITSRTFLEAAAGILAVEAYHAGLVRTELTEKGVAIPDLIAATEAISNARDSLDGPSDIDQGVASRGLLSNIVPADADGITYSRSAGQTLNIVYLSSAAVTGGGFFPNGVNGTIRTSAASA